MEIVKLSPPSVPSNSASPYLITAIKPAAKVENRVNVFINDKYDFSLEITQVVDLHLKVGKRLTEKELNDCRHASEFGKLYCHTLEFALTRPHSIREVRDHLKKRRLRREVMNRQAIKNRSKSKEECVRFKLPTKEMPLYTDQDIDAVVSCLMEKGYLNDQKFAEFYIENRYVKKGISKKRLTEELKNKGISQEHIERAFQKSGRDESEEIKKIINRKIKKYSSEKLIQYLVRQGFDYQQVKAAVSEMDSQSSAQNPLW